jgi:hypothetical protein
LCAGFDEFAQGRKLAREERRDQARAAATGWFLVFVLVVPVDVADGSGFFFPFGMEFEIERPVGAAALAVSELFGARFAGLRHAG